jgi:small subunit ribosomal protein S6e
MPSFKIVVADPKTRKSQSLEINDPQAQSFLGLKLGEEIDGTLFGLAGKIKITGGSDRAGFPMRQDVSGGVKSYVLLTKGVGYRKDSGSGRKRRKLVRGNTITEEIYQINAVLS